MGLQIIEYCTEKKGKKVHSKTIQSNQWWFLLSLQSRDTFWLPIYVYINYKTILKYRQL